MGKEGIHRVALAGALALALALGTADAGAVAPATITDAATDIAIVEVSTPALPSGMGAPERESWRRARARSRGVLDRVAERNELSVESRLPETGQLTVDLAGESVDELRQRLSGDPQVQRVEADRPVEFRYLPNDLGFNIADPNAPAGDFAQWNLRGLSGPAAWDTSKGIGAEVSVIDTGTDVGHPDLGARTAGTLDCDPGPCAGTGVTDTDGHGTHVAGLACGDSDNVYGVASLGFDCSLFAIKITTCAGAADAIVAAANRGSDAINMSFGGCSPILSDEVGYAFALGSVPVAAADNQANPPINWPSQAVQPRGTGPNLDTGQGLVVTAVRYDGVRATIAEATTSVSVAAYGFATDTVGGQQGILSTWPGAVSCSCRTALNGDSRFAYLVGTSMATPQVSGVVALMRSVNPALTAPKLIRLVKLTSSHCGLYKDGIGWGVINAADAVEAALGKDSDPPVSSMTRSRRRKLKINSFDSACHPDLPASGIKKVRIFSSRNGKAFRRIAKTSKRTFRFEPKRKGRYRFYSVAVDNAGNAEAAPTAPDEELRIKSTPKGSKKKKSSKRKK